MTDVGLVTWLNEKGERAGMDRETYLDAREMTMQNYTRAGLAGYLNPMIDTEGRRTPDGVSLGFTAETSLSDMLDEVIPWIRTAIDDGVL